MNKMAEANETHHNYELIKQIGTGSFGVVYLVKKNGNSHVKTEFLVMKQISLTKLDTRQRFDAQKEITLLSTLIHPNIVSYRESFQTESQHLHIVMDYCDGGDLYRKIVDRKKTNVGPFDERQLMHWFVQVCLALKFIHEKKILHRDLKTQNIFTCDGDNIVKLGDFGIARILDHTADLAATCIGTPYYLSPEVCQNRPYGTKTDVWALGCVLYELATFRHPFEGRHLTELLTKIVRGTYDPLPVVYSSRLKHLIGQMLKVNSNERPDVIGLLQREYVYDRAVDYLKNTQRLTELVAVEELCKHKRPSTHTALNRSVRRLGINANYIHRQSIDNAIRKKTSVGNGQRAYFEKKFRMYMPSSVRIPKKGGPHKELAAGRRRPQTAVECHIPPTDPVPPCSPTPMAPIQTSVEAQEGSRRLDDETGGSSFGVTITMRRGKAVSTNDLTVLPFTPANEPKKRERKRWAALRPPEITILPNESSHSNSLNNIAMPERKSNSSLMKVSKPCTAPLFPSLPGSVSDGWCANTSQVCETCGKPFMVENARQTVASATKQCQACCIARRQAAKIDAKEGNSIYEKIECLRLKLEQRLGVEKFARFYKDYKGSESMKEADDDIRGKMEGLIFLEKAYLN